MTELEELEEKQRAADNKKAMLNAGSGALNSLLNHRSAAEILLKEGPLNKDYGSGLRAAAENVADPMSNSAKAQAYIKAKRENALATAGDDAASPDSLAMQEHIGQIFPKLAPVVKGKSKTQIAEMFPLIKAKMDNDNARENAYIQAGERNRDRSERRQDKQDLLDEKREKERKDRTTIFGVARTDDDAKKLKEAGDMKAKLDSEIKELITLRKTYGAEAANRDVVARAKQLSNSLLLTKKNLETLGVLSQSDRDIVDEIIPSDPTQFNWSQLAGQDPTLTKLEAFQKDTNRDFETKLKGRLEEYAPPKRNIVKQERNKKTGEVRVTFDDGSTEIVPRTAGR